MRYVGIYSASRPGVVREFSNLIPQLDSGARGASITVVSFPAEQPIVAMAVDEHDTKLSVARLADGTFGLIDGEVYDSPGGVGDPSTFQSRADISSAVLEQYRTGGVPAYGKVNGNASMVIWDAQSNQLLLFRARSGIPPLYYARHNGVVLWAPDLTTLLACGVPSDLDHEALDLFLSLSYISAPWTMFSHIRKVPSGRVVRISKDSLSTRQYYNLDWKPKHSLSPVDTVSRFRALFEQALERRIRTHRRYAVLLSGGVDSALVVAGLSRLVGSEGVEAFTFNYSSYDGGLNEAPQARRTAAQFHVRHHAIEVGPERIVRDLDRFLWQYEEPFAYGLHSAYLGDVAANGFSVVFVGAGPVSVGLRRAEHWTGKVSRLPLQAVFGLSARALRRAEAVLPRITDLRRAMELAAKPLPVTYARPHMSVDVSRRSLLSDPSNAGQGTQKAMAVYAHALASVRGESYRDQLLYLRTAFDVPDNVSRWLHQWSSAQGLTVRDPLWDDDLIAFHIKLRRDYTGKDDLRQLALSYMPAEMAFAPKVFQSIPIGHWLKGPLRELLMSYLSPERLKSDGIFQPQTVSLLIDEHVTGGIDHGWTLWSLLAVSVWLDVVVRRQHSPLNLVSAS